MIFRGSAQSPLCLKPLSEVKLAALQIVEKECNRSSIKERFLSRKILNDRNPDVGTPLEELFGDTEDVILDVAIPSNRGDCLSYVGIARELRAIFGGIGNEIAVCGG